MEEVVKKIVASASVAISSAKREAEPVAAAPVPVPAGEPVGAAGGSCSRSARGRRPRAWRRRLRSRVAVGATVVAVVGGAAAGATPLAVREDASGVARVAETGRSSCAVRTLEGAVAVGHGGPCDRLGRRSRFGAEPAVGGVEVQAAAYGVGRRGRSPATAPGGWRPAATSPWPAARTASPSRGAPTGPPPVGSSTGARTSTTGVDRVDDARLDRSNHRSNDVGDRRDDGGDGVDDRSDDRGDRLDDLDDRGDDRTTDRDDRLDDLGSTGSTISTTGSTILVTARRARRLG